jgi:hypothetical protein
LRPPTPILLKSAVRATWQPALDAFVATMVPVVQQTP